MPVTFGTLESQIRRLDIFVTHLGNNVIFKKQAVVKIGSSCVINIIVKTFGIIALLENSGTKKAVALCTVKINIPAVASHKLGGMRKPKLSRLIKVKVVLDILLQVGIIIEERNGFLSYKAFTVICQNMKICIAPGHYQVVLPRPTGKVGKYLGKILSFTKKVVVGNMSKLLDLAPQAFCKP